MKLYDMSDEPERKSFLDKLIGYQEERGTPITQCPTISKVPLDLYRLYLAVKERGGFVEVSRAKLWKECTVICNIATSSSAAYTLRKQYIKHLFPFECKFDRGGVDPQPILASLDTSNRKKNKNAVPPPEPPFQGHTGPPSIDGYGPPGSYPPQPPYPPPNSMPNSEYPQQAPHPPSGYPHPSGPPQMSGPPPPHVSGQNSASMPQMNNHEGLNANPPSGYPHLSGPPPMTGPPPPHGQNSASMPPMTNHDSMNVNPATGYPHPSGPPPMSGPPPPHISGQNSASVPPMTNHESISVKDPFSDDMQHRAGYHSRPPSQPPAQSSAGPPQPQTGPTPPQQSNDYNSN